MGAANNEQQPEPLEGPGTTAWDEELEGALAEGGRRNDADVARPRPTRRPRRYRHRPTETVGVGSFTGNLPEELLSYLGSGYRHVMIAELDDFRYVQFLVTERDAVCTEVASNVNQHPDHLLGYAEQLKLTEIGFADPVANNPNQPNYHLKGHGPGAVVPACLAVARVLREVYGCSAGDQLTLRRFDTLPEEPDDRFADLAGLV